ncbi:aKG-HExxH-type peptide beta-hydroxylase [Pseudomonas aeruginosa]|uniref:aKG-HExxH-type peptide beta-hydroxylase n=1 Tax=Pseudomonas aeruginosa TaxID=287 RepID=UPI003FD532FD
MSPGTDRPWNSAFQPDRGLGAFHSLRKAILAQRTQLGLDALKQCDEVLRTAQEPGLPEPLLNIREGEGGSTLVFDDPVYSIWLRFFLRASANRRTEELIRHISKLPSVLQDVERRLTGKANLYVPGSAIALQREDLHPYVMKATPPTYDFSRAPSSSGEEGRTIGHPLRMQAGLLGSALKNIETAWPELHAQIEECVRIFGYLPDAAFRSCSAARYSGIVYLGNMDESLLDLEESIVHETGHQVLYQLGEMTRLTLPQTPLEANYVLPWSGSRRDLFGFLHAHYIYALLVKYYWRRANLDGREAAECRGRALLILSGCLKATPMLQGDANLTEQGRIIVERLAEELAELDGEIRGRVRHEREKANAEATG